MVEQRLTPEGAQRLRAVRQRFQERPELYSYNWEEDCGTRGCIGGWLCCDAGERVRSSIRASALLGIELTSCVEEADGILNDLFYRHSSAETAIERINEFLWHYGYPPDEIAQPAPETVAVQEA